MRYDGLKSRAENLARLLADEAGAEILAEMQKLSLETAALAPTSAAKPASGSALAASGTVGAWEVGPTPLGPELRRRPLDADELRAWADVDHVPGADGATRVVLLGESSARGFLLDPLLTPALALQRRLDGAGGRFQVVDLAHTGADLRDLTEITLQLPQIEPDVIVVYAGNNWVRPRHTPAHLDVLAAALRTGGYPMMRRTYVERIVGPGVRRVLAALTAVAEACSAELVLVVPEFNLQGWSADPELELPPLPSGDLLAWSAQREQAEAALAAGDHPRVMAATDEMARLDQGLSPVTGRLRGLAAPADQPALARAALEESRDAVCGLLTAHTPRVTSEVREWLLTAIAERNLRSVDLADLFRTVPDAPCPGPEFFLDYCHLSSQGIETMAEALGGLLAGFDAGGSKPLGMLSKDDEAIGDILAAVHNSYYGQPRERVEGLVRRAVDGSPAGRAFAGALLHLLEGQGPVWSSAPIRELTQRPHAARYLAPMLSRSAETLGMWTLREALLDVVGPPPADDAAADDAVATETVDLLLTAEQGLIEGAFGAVNHRPERSFFQAFGRSSQFGFRLSGVDGAGAQVHLTYRVPAAAVAGTPIGVAVNGHAVGVLEAKDSWTSARLAIPDGLLRDGVNGLELQWPCGGGDWSARRIEDARALARGDYPLVLGVQGELFDLLLKTDR